ncbi:maleylpyruvate isomerase family mycothiol-dependent enzyme [Kribbella qitaiheensis]|uniref:Maleylpyruvate isomerase family mycothiol-dependent enzyme n=1 Tax=Kribbella qitaiheensis TaxID=1544730 RepID=A0A7G6WV06_9ACTN|nr:maleylpyruvate isomerase family mycothiol-dependent enzyme [Kribbella qitaiheensis]QNE17821.1 maleylpyruvate isomerase family mycothiol-dependent enzyme [Kribbella qitaiheensis]
MTDIRTAVTGERADLAVLLDELLAADWDEPTLCEGWRVRELVAHIVMPYRLSRAGFLLGMARAGGRFNRFADRHARSEAAALSAAELTETLRQNADNPWKPPGGGDQGALSHDVIHGLDLTVALGLDRRVPLERLRFILDDMDPRGVKYFGVDLTGIQLRATDLDWTYGAGEPLTGTAQDLLLVISGRRLPAGYLTGRDAPRFTAGGRATR